MKYGWFIQGLIFAVVFGVPAGAIGALTIQRTMKYGFKAGFVTGLGSVAADIVYAGIGAFGITMISSFLERNEKIIGIVCGTVILALGFWILLKKQGAQAVSEPSASTLRHAFFSSLALAFMNPATLLAFIAAFAGLGITRVPNLMSGILMVLGVAIGTTLWWLLLAGLSAWLKSRLSAVWMARIAKAMGAMMIAAGIYSIVRVL